ncbi:hypothetical protein ACFFIX_13965 [Metabacillus herbersteinensis]|uniref:Uncharacterized protein n=1 Tax=Metabacillus herbersteinensis TaxID=283816 RepID=A0ABV6GFU0_9BACI
MTYVGGLTNIPRDACTACNVAATAAATVCTAETAGVAPYCMFA